MVVPDLELWFSGNQDRAGNQEWWAFESARSPELWFFHQQRIYHVFISSTFTDLKDERRRISEAVAKAGYVPEGMELFPASSEKQLAFIKRVIDRCDYYVVVVGGRYGTASGKEGVSYTEREYDYALSREMPALAFLPRHPDKIETGKADQDNRSKQALAAFKKKLSASAMVDFWEDAVDCRLELTRGCH